MPDTVRTSKTSLALTLDGVSIKLETSFLPGETFSASAPGDALQSAVWATLEPLSELTIVAAPFGTKPPTENVPTAAPGAKAEYYKGFDQAREMGEVYVLEQTNRGPKIRIFGKKVTGKATLAEAQSATGGGTVPILTVEWVSEAGQRMWIVRASHEAAPGTATLAALKPLLDSLGDIVLRSNTLELATTVPLTVAPPPRSMDAEEQLVEEDMLVAGPMMAGAAANLPAPPWWNGVCNRVNYRNELHVDSFPLGSGYRGLVPCGPRPGKEGDRVVRFFPGAWGEYEFQCVELCMRFMKLAYDIDPYQGNGSQVVSNFATRTKMKDRGKLKIIPNGNAAPAPVPGDVLSYGPTTVVGHTSICIESNVDAQGNGTITVLEQNNSQQGRQMLPVKRWQVQGTPQVTAFLHPTNDGGDGGNPPFDPTPVFFPETGQFVGHGFKQLWFKT
ncbi:MAG: hypothetical protein QOH93_3306, partial [Chloroflexia bacterium]|nr:hypothetical protein [Chloroflexia bacterium]